MERKKVLIVDDNEEFLNEFKETLELSGYELVAVNDASVAVAVARQAKPDVALLDLKMSKKSGFQLASELRLLPALAHTPIIAMSAFYKDDYRALLDACGIKRCLRKPIQPLDAIAEIEEALSE